jgi:catechol 2,3-dioxygenase-like lactoylglutathione lyase family enzyme
MRDRPGVGLHHLALGARDVERVAAFYRDLLGLAAIGLERDEAGAVRSVWLDLGGPILMVERTEEAPRPVRHVGAGPFLVALGTEPEARAGLEKRLEAAGHPIEYRTEYTSYTRDPEGNRVGLSHWPRTATG